MTPTGLLPFLFRAAAAQIPSPARRRVSRTAHVAMGRPLIHGVDLLDCAISINGPVEHIRIEDVSVTGTTARRAPAKRHPRGLEREARRRRS